MFRRFSISLALAVAAALLVMAADHTVRIRGNGADRAKVKPRDRVVWTGNNWSVSFEKRSPCQNGKMTFSSTEQVQNRSCVISVTCTNADKSGCGVYKYTSAADGAKPVDPEIEVEPQ